jgi:hypothetical protein
MVNTKPWQEAVERQTDALRITETLIRSQITEAKEMSSGWKIDYALVKAADPYVWSEDAMNAVLLASESVPLDSKIEWKLPSRTVWWYFEKPLPFQTISNIHMGIRALAFGWLRVTDGKVGVVFPKGTLTDKIFDGVMPFGMPCVCWVDGQEHNLVGTPRIPIAPSQTWEWGNELTLGDMLSATKAMHDRLYAIKGKWANREHIDVDLYMRTTERIAKFIIAALAWLSQKVIVTSPGQVERHVRKRNERALNKPLGELRVVNLRKKEYQHQEDGVFESEAHRQLSCQFHVSGHWRNQAWGTAHTQRRLTWIDSYVKGPSDKPFRTPQKKVYRVSQ